MAIPLPNPLYPLHEQAEAEFQAYAELQIVCTFGEVQAEYAAIRKGCGLFDQPQRGFLELTGKDRLPFLNNLLTNQTWDKQANCGLPAGQGVYAFFLNNKGRIITDLTVLELHERTLLEMDARMVEPTRTLLDRYLFGEQVQIASRIGAVHEIALHGPGGKHLLSQALDLPLPDLPPLASIPARLFGHEVTIWRDDPAGVPGHHLILPAEAAAPIWMNLITRFSTTDQAGKRPLRPVGWAAFNSCRIEAGRPLFGIDFDESVLPAETGQLTRAVSLTKGCYLGQEIVARMHSRGQISRQLVGIRMANDALPMAGQKVYDDQHNEIGGITSSTISPVLSNAAICLGYVKRAFIDPGTTVHIPAEGAMHQGVVTPLPFC